tara:strand:+ start:3255 stop:4340 length:1086 start_codon:yes stop_codon:yes gene_type:complete
MRTLKRPMFRKGGSVNEGIMHGLEDRKGYDKGGRIEPFNRYTADTFGSPYYDNEVVMENLRRFQELGMGNPYRELSGKAGFDSIADYIFRPAKNSIFKKIYEAAPIVKAEKAEKEVMEKEAELRPYKKYFSSDGEVNYKTPPDDENDDGDLGDMSGKGTGTKGTGTIDDISVSDLNKERMKIFAPGMQKRMINDALAAASEAFGTSTGDTKQDIANAISAAAKGMGGTKDLYDKISMMTLSGEIQKDIEKSKEKKLGNYEFLAKLSKEDPTTFNKIMKQEDKNKYEELLDQTGSTDSASRLWAKRKYPDVKDTFSAAEAKKVKIEDLADGVYYIGMGKDGDRFFKVEGGKIDDKFSRSGVL